MNVNVDINQLVSDIAQKLGVAVDKVYPMLYKQAMINGVWDIIWVVLSGLGLFLTFKWAMWLKTKLSEKYACFDDNIFQFIGLVLLGIINFVVFFSCLEEIINIFFNTDWYIIQYVMNYIK